MEIRSDCCHTAEWLCCKKRSRGWCLGWGTARDFRILAQESWVGRNGEATWKDKKSLHMGKPCSIGGGKRQTHTHIYLCIKSVSPTKNSHSRNCLKQKLVFFHLLCKHQTVSINVRDKWDFLNISVVCLSVCLSVRLIGVLSLRTVLCSSIQNCGHTVFLLNLRTFMII